MAAPVAASGAALLSHPFDRLSLLRQSVCIALASVVVGLVMAYVSAKLPIDEVVKRMTTRIYLPVLARNYSPKGQNAITVMTLDDVDLREYGLSWPVPLDYYQRLLDRLTAYQPKAVFVDVLFLDDRPQAQIDKFVKSACSASDRGVAVFLATVPRYDGTLATGDAAFMAPSNVERALATAVNQQGSACVTLTLATISPDKLDHSQWQYPLTRTPDGKRSSVALAMFCHFYAAQCPTELEEPQALIWATSAAPTNAQTMITAGTGGQRSTPLCRGRWNGWEAVPFLSATRGAMGMTPLLPLCPYHQVVPIRAFKSLDNPTPGYGFSPAEVASALTGKMVLVGADLVAVGDNAISPLHGRLPGVHVHAMALDNLIETDGAYIQNGEFGLKNGWLTRTNFFTAFAVFLVAVVIAAMRFFRRRHQPADHVRPVFWTPDANAAGGSAPNTEGRPQLQKALTWLLIVPVVLGFPKISKEGWKRLLLWFALSLLISLIISFWLITLGYHELRQGPLVIVEYVLFPLAAGFSHAGETLARRVALFWASRRMNKPWAWLQQVQADNHPAHK